MGWIRRNTITHRDAVAVAVVAAVAGVVAALAGCRPTGEAVPDAVLCVATGAAVTWLAASAPWWALLTAAGVAVAGVIGGPVTLVLLALVAVAVASWIGAARANQPVLRAGIGGLVVQVVLRLEFDPFFLASALVAAVALLLVAVTGAQRRQRYVRVRILWTAVGVAAVAVVAAGAMGVAGLQHRDSFTAGYRSMLNGLEHMQDGDVPAARAALVDAAEDLGAASDGFSGVLTQPARLLPGVAQNRAAAADVLSRAADAATTAADTLALVDLDQLRVVDGVIDVAALATLSGPLDTLEATVLELQSALADAGSPWLVAPIASRIDSSRARADQVAHQSTALAATARAGPAMLGADGPRRYFLAFVNSAEARAHSGLMGNWSELTIDRGRLSITRSGRTAELQRVIDDDDVFVTERDSYFVRYGPFGAGRTPDTGVFANLWANVTMAPDMPTVGNVMAQMYEAYAGYPVDGVFVIDPAGVAALLAITGRIDTPELPHPLDASNAEEFLLFGQYAFAESEREDFLEAVTDATVDQVLGSTLPAPQQLARTMADPVLHGHISGWASRPDEQEVFTLVGMDAALPVLAPLEVGAEGWAGDAFAVLNDNANPNKIDSFLERTITYAATVDERTGEVAATLRVELTNSAPTRDLDDYVIGNRHGLPPGSNRTILTVLSPHERVGYLLDGVPQAVGQVDDLGWSASQLFVDVLPGATVLAELTYEGRIAPGPYELLVRPQPLPNADAVHVVVTSAGGRTIVDHDEPLARRSVLSAAGVRAWR